METTPRDGCFMIVAGSGGGENGERYWRTRTGGLSFHQILEKHSAMAGCTGADGSL